MEENDIFTIHGTDYKNMAKRILEQAGVAADIGDTNKKVALKPNLVTAKAPLSGVAIHSELLVDIIEYLQGYGFQNIIIIEDSWVGDHTEDASQTAGYHQVCSRYGAPFMDSQRDTWKEYDAGGMKIELRDRAAAMDYIINMSVLKRHCQTTVACVLKNSKGAIPNSEKRHFHTSGPHEPIAHLNTIVRNDFILVDNICGDLDFKEGGDPAVMNHVLGFKDPVLCDAFVCDCMGYLVDDVSYITMVRNPGTRSISTVHANMIYLNRTTEAYSRFRMTRRVQYLIVHTAPKDTCSVCYGSLIYALDRLNDMGYLRRGLSPVCTGQGYKRQEGAVDMGQCTSYFAKTLGGCLPKAVDIVELPGNQWQ